MLITTLMIALAMIQLKGFPVLVALAYFLLAAFIDCLFFGASLKKVPHGAWFPLGLAVVILAALTSWAWARGLEEKFDRLHRYRLSELMRPKLEDEDDRETRDEKHPEQDIAEVNALGLAPQGGFVRRKPALQGAGGADLNRLPVFALYALFCCRDLSDSDSTLGFRSFHNHSSSSSEGAPHAFSAFLRSYPALPQVIVRAAPFLRPSR